MYATLDGNDFSSILKVSNNDLEKGAAGRVIFKTPPQVKAASIIP